MTDGAANGAAIEAEIAWFTRVLDLRFRIHGGEFEEADVLALAPPPELSREVPYGAAAADLAPGERLILIVAMLPHLRPHALDAFLIANSQTGRPFTEFGGAPASAGTGFRPTRETALFLLAGESIDRRLEAMRLFEPGAPLHARRILDYPAESGETGSWMPLIVSLAWLGRLTTGEARPPRFGPGFPAQLITSLYEWRDLVLPEDVGDELDDLATWVENESTLMDDWGLKKHLKPGYRALFYGPPGTGKTVTAAVLGKRLGNKPVYRVDLSRVVSKWIGETEKNLATLFDHAADGDMILFFDEADALFGKRGDTKSANDRHANQQIAYLLQRIEDCPGVVILASNLRANIDEAFARRFQAVVQFPMPEVPARRELWTRLLDAVPEGRLPASDLQALAESYPLAGGTIVNVLRRVCITSLTLDRPPGLQDVKWAVE
ncbi:MAG TPA: ATP-binding protein, partial [Allosphingosinicella sp.]|nr:ATP-binding protein [Allosphingosinicella sp.]